MCSVWLKHRIQVGGAGQSWDRRDTTEELGRPKSCHAKGQDITLGCFGGRGLKKNFIVTWQLALTFREMTLFGLWWNFGRYKPSGRGIF